MVLSEWAHVWELYKSCGALRFIKAVYSPARGVDYWHLWVSTILYLISAGLIAFLTGVWVFLGICLFVLTFFMFFYSAEKSISEQFQDEYGKHSIDDYPLRKRRLYLRYALFLNDLAEKYHTENDVEKLIAYADLLDEKRESWIFQNQLVVYLIAVITGLSVNLIMQSEMWKGGNGLVFLFLLTAGFLFVSSVLDIMHGPKRRFQEIKKFLKWAKMDIVEARLNLVSLPEVDHDKAPIG